MLFDKECRLWHCSLKMLRFYSGAFSFTLLKKEEALTPFNQKETDSQRKTLRIEDIQNGSPLSLKD